MHTRLNRFKVKHYIVNQTNERANIQGDNAVKNGITLQNKLMKNIKQRACAIVVEGDRYIKKNLRIMPNFPILDYRWDIYILFGRRNSMWY